MPFVYFSLVSCKKGHLYTLSIPFFSVGIDRLANKGTKKSHIRKCMQDFLCRDANFSSLPGIPPRFSW